MCFTIKISCAPWLNCERSFFFQNYVFCYIDHKGINTDLSSVTLLCVVGGKFPYLSIHPQAKWNVLIVPSLDRFSHQPFACCPCFIFDICWLQSMFIAIPVILKPPHHIFHGVVCVILHFPRRFLSVATLDNMAASKECGIPLPSSGIQTYIQVSVDCSLSTISGKPSEVLFCLQFEVDFQINLIVCSCQLLYP